MLKDVKYVELVVTLDVINKNLMENAKKLVASIIKFQKEIIESAKDGKITKLELLGMIPEAWSVMSSGLKFKEIAEEINTEEEAKEIALYTKERVEEEFKELDQELIQNVYYLFTSLLDSVMGTIYLIKKIKEKDGE